MGDTRFVSFIFNDSEQTKKQWTDAYTSFQSNPNQVSIFLGNREISGSFIAGFEVYGIRIGMFVQQISRHNISKTRGKDKEELDSGQHLAGLVINKVITPLIDHEYQHLHSRDALLQLLFSTIALADRSTFDQLASQLGRAPILLAKLISDQRSAKLIEDWVGYVRPNAKAMLNWAEVSVNLAKNCDSDHGVLSETERWDLLTTLKSYLHKADTPEPEIQSIRRKHTVGRVLTGGRLLGRDGYFEGLGSRVDSISAPIPPDIMPEGITLLNKLGMVIPRSKRSLSNTIDHIETNETFPIFQTALRTFPCRLCFTRGYGVSSNTIVPPVQTDFEQQADTLDSDSFEGLLGGGLGVWKISLSTQALRDLKHSQREGNFSHIKPKLEALASGDWIRKAVAREVSDHNHHFRVRVFQALYGANGRILWQVDVGFDEKQNADSQIVRVWRIGDVKEIQSSLDSVYRAQQGFSPVRIERCKMNVIDKQLKTKIPAVFGDIDQEETDKMKSMSGGLPQDMLISGKFHTLTGTVIESILRGQSHSDFPFDVTGKEVEIIKNKNATFILGRSGTGKTSCLLYKLMSRYLARNIAQPESPIRQMLLTRSEPLARKLGSEVQLLIDTQLLRVKAGFNYLDDGEEISLQARDGMDEDTTEDFLSLQKENFPLVCTFGHFLKRLENTIRGNDRKDFSVDARTGATVRRSRLIDFVIFKEAYWAQFPANMKGSLEPDLVFAEIMGVIKGAASLMTGLKPLSREEYKTMSYRLAPTFARTEDRDTVYRIFESYENKKMQTGDYDGIDRVRTIMNELTENTTLRRRVEAIFEEVYVDEVQDQRPLEIELLLNLVQNPRGIHFAGDSAQCISKDSTFRFANLKALFFNHFSGSRFTRIDPSIAKPQLFSLSRNFRSHQGILSLASFVMELLWKGFPDMVDKLPPEVGDYVGPKPIIFVGLDLVEFLQMAGKSVRDTKKATGRTEQNGRDSEKQVKTQQIIIIRDHNNQQELQSKLGGGSLVFTILQSKGMEYDDVFLYNFFSSSPCWRAFKSLQELLVPGANPSYGASHMSMCSELKNLYVAITRPRSRLWILENNPGFIPELLTERAPSSLVDIRHFGTEDLPLMMPEVRPTNATTAREWIETGEQCMERGLFDQALRCFNNAGDQQKVILAEACIAEQAGKECRARNDREGLDSNFGVASDCFLKLNMKERAAICLESKEDFEGAAELYRQRGRSEKAASLFETAKLYEQAAQQYHQAGKTLKALQALHKGKLYEVLVKDVHTYLHTIEDGDRKSYARECNIILRQKGTPPKIGPDLWTLTFDMFTSDLEKEEFLVAFDHKEELLGFYIKNHRTKDAFLYSSKSGEIDSALEVIIDQVQKYGAQSELQDLEDVFIHAQTGKVLAKMSRTSPGGVDLTCDKRYLGKGCSSRWKDLVTVAGKYFKSGIKLERGCIEKDWIRGYLDIVISVDIPYFMKTAVGLSDLPLDYLCGLAETTKELSESKSLSKEVLCALGVLHIPGRKRPFILLKWSLLTPDSSGVRELEFDKLIEKAVNYLTKQVTSACSVIEERALAMSENLLKLENCASCVTRAGWDRPEKVGVRATRCSHEPMSKVEFKKFMQGLINIISSFIKLEVQYVKLNEYFLDTLLMKLTYRSSFFENAEEIVAAQEFIHTPDGSGVLARLRDRFLQRWRATMRSHIGGKHDFSSLLENFQLARHLGIEQDIVNESLTSRPSTAPHTSPSATQEQPEMLRGRGIWSALAGRGGETQPQKVERAPDPVYEAFMSYYTLHQPVDPPGSCYMAILSQRIDRLLNSIFDLRISTQCMSFFQESVVTIYEEILTLLLFSIKRTDVVIPESWVKLHLPRWAESLKVCTRMEQCCYQQILLRSVSSFCEWISKIESPPQGRWREPNISTRRSVNLLVVSLINIGTVGPVPLGYQKVWTTVQKVFGNKTLGTDNIIDVQPQNLMEPLTRAFQLYNGKDSILVFIQEGRVSRHIDAWRRAGIMFQSFPLLLNPSGPPTRSEIKSAYLIQTWYRINEDRRARDRVHLTTTLGKAVHAVYHFCRFHGSQLRSRRKFLEFVAVMMIEGLELYLVLDTLSSQITAAREIPLSNNSIEDSRREFIKHYEAQLDQRFQIFSTNSPITFSLEAKSCRSEFSKQIACCMELVERIAAYTKELPRLSEASKRKGKGGSNVDTRAGNLPKNAQKGGKGKFEVEREAKTDEISKQQPLKGAADHIKMFIEGKRPKDEARLLWKEDPVLLDLKKKLSWKPPPELPEVKDKRLAGLGGKKESGEVEKGDKPTGKQVPVPNVKQRDNELAGGNKDSGKGGNVGGMVLKNQKGKGKEITGPALPEGSGGQKNVGTDSGGKEHHIEAGENKGAGPGKSQQGNANTGGNKKNKNKKKNKKKGKKK